MPNLDTGMSEQSAKKLQTRVGLAILSGENQGPCNRLGGSCYYKMVKQLNMNAVQASTFYTLVCQQFPDACYEGGNRVSII